MYATIFPFRNIEIVAQAYDGFQALDLYSSIEPKPDIVIMDQRMPRLYGVSVTRFLLELDPSANIIFLSADEEFNSRSLRLGAKKFLLKPISLPILVDAILQCAED